MATLEDCGIDLSIPPFSLLFAGNPGSLSKSFSLYMDKGEDGLLWLLEEFTFMPVEMQSSFLDELSRISDPRVLDLLSLLIWHDDKNIAGAVVAATGRIRLPAAAALLEAFRVHADPALHRQIDQSLRRLAFVGIKADRADTCSPLLPFHSAFAGPVDGGGYRQIWLARYRNDGRLDTIELQTHDVNGIKGVWGDTALLVEDFEEKTNRRCQEELIEPVDSGYALLLLRDALFRSREEGYPLPPEFLLRRTMFATEELLPASYDPPCAGWQVKVTPRLLARSAELFDDEFFAGWYLESGLVYEMAEEWVILEKSATGELLAGGLERFIETICREEFQPRLQEISRRLFLNADYLARIGVDGELVKAALSAADSVRQFSLPCHLHPFLRRFAMESLIVARESMEEGYDVRDYLDDDWD
jgi:hypothetical protein